MAFIGNNLGSVLTEVRTVDTMVGDGIVTTLTLSKTPGSANNVEVFYDGVFQSPNEDFTLLENILTFSSAPPNNVKVVVLSGNDSQVVYPEKNSITSSKILDGVIESSKINDIAVEKVSGTLPALNGEAVTGLNIPAAVDVTTSSADPTITSNKPLGSLWVNSTSGDMFVITNATTDQNVWINVGVGVYSVYSYAGKVQGYLSRLDSEQIETVSLVNDGGGTEVAGLVWTKGIEVSSSAGSQSHTHGYSAGGTNVGTTYETAIEKIQFASAAASTDAGTLSVGSFGHAGHMSLTHGYTSGGTDAYNAAPAPGNLARNIKIIQKYSFAAVETSVTIGNLDNSVRSLVGWSTTTHGYSCNGDESIPSSNLTQKDTKVQKFSFFSDGDAVATASTSTVGRSSYSTTSSATHAYGAGGHGPSYSTVIDKFSYASEAAGTGVGDLDQPAYGSLGLSSTTHGYCCGGVTPTAIAIIAKYSFSSDGNASNIGNLTVASRAANSQGSQY
jgi:hypothetical protein